MAVLGRLVLDIMAKNGTFRQTLDDSARRANSFAAKSNIAMAKAAKGYDRMRKSVEHFAQVHATKLKVALLALPAAAAAAGKTAVSFAAEISRAAKEANIGAEALQEYRFAASKANIEVRQLDEGVRRFNRRFGEAKGGRGFVNDFNVVIGGAGQFASTEQALDAVISKLADIKDGSERASLASRVFGEDAGPKIAVLLGHGSEAIKAYRKEARELGLVLSNDVVAQAEQAEVTFRVIGEQFKIGTAQAILTHADAIGEFASQVSDAVPKLIAGAVAVGDFFGLFSDTGQGRLREIDSQIKNINDRLYVPGSGGPTLDRFNLPRISTESSVGQQMLRNLEALKQERIQLLDELEAERILRDEQAEKLLALANGGSETGIDTRNVISFMPRRKEDVLKALDKQYADLGATIADSVLTPMERFRREQEQLNFLFENGYVTQETYNRKLGELREELEASLPAVQLLERSMGSMFDDFIAGSGKAGDAFRTFSRSVVAGILEMYLKKPLMDALLSGVGAIFSGGASAGTGAAAATPVIGHFNEGADFIVGGAPGRDTNLVSFMATRGERVRVDPVGSAGGDGTVVVLNQSLHFDTELSYMQDLVRTGMTIAKEEAKGEIAEIVRRGGAPGKAFGGR